MSRATEFWVNGSPAHQQIARTFYENIEYDHPEIITSDRLLPECLSYDEAWAPSSVTYHEYTGPRITTIE